MLLAFAFVLAGTNTVPVQPDLDAAKAWVQLLDTKQWDQSWSATGQVFQARMPKSRWSITIQPVREPLGQVVSRSQTQLTSTHTLPGVPDGDYEVVQYHTTFTNKASAVETVVLARENGRWKVEGYFIR